MLLCFFAFAPVFSWPEMTSPTTLVFQNSTCLQGHIQMFSLIFPGRIATCSSEFIEFNILYVMFTCPFYRLIYTQPHWIQFPNQKLGGNYMSIKKNIANQDHFRKSGLRDCHDDLLTLMDGVCWTQTSVTHPFLPRRVLTTVSRLDERA